MTRSKYHYWYWDEVPCLPTGGAQGPWTRVRASCWRSTKWNGLARWLLGYVFFRNPNSGHFKVCLVSEVEVILQPCGHLCLCEPCSLSIRRHFFSFFYIFPHQETFFSIYLFIFRSHFLTNRLRDLMFGGPVPRTPCPICRFTNNAQARQLD